MLTPASGSVPYRVIGIDPGGDTIGFSVLGWDTDQRKVYLEYAATLEAQKTLKHHKHLMDTHDDRFVRQLVIQQHLQQLLYQFRPQAVVSEAPFLGRFPQAFSSLTEILQLLRLTVFQYDNTMRLDTVDPPSVKKAVGVHGKTKDKTLVASGVNQLGLINNTGRPILAYDEHTTDAIAVAWWRLSSLIQ